jgi:hypothetical protein
MERDQSPRPTETCLAMNGQDHPWGIRQREELLDDVLRGCGAVIKVHLHVAEPIANKYFSIVCFLVQSYNGIHT